MKNLTRTTHNLANELSHRKGSSASQKDVAYLRKYRPCGDQGFLKLAEELLGGLMMPILLIKKCDEEAGVGDDHGLIYAN